jgi:hypothetical protein
MSARKPLPRAKVRRRAPIPPPVEVKPKPAPGPNTVLEDVVAIYSGHRPPTDALPFDLVSFEVFTVKYGHLLVDRIGPERVRELLFGENRSVEFGKSSARPGTPWAAITVFPVLQKGRAISDLRRAFLMVHKAVGTIS